MKIEEGVSRLSFFSSLYEEAKERLAGIGEELERNERQYRGDDRIDGSTERATAVRNITYEIVESQVSSDIPQPKVTAAEYSEERERLAHAIERLCVSVRDELPFEEMNDLDERYTYVYGGSVWLVEWEENGNGRGGVRVDCISPRDFFPQPELCRIEDMEYCFFRFDTTREELCRRYGVKPEVAADAGREGESDGIGETVTVVVCYYRGEDGSVCRFVFSGDAVLEDAVGYFKRRIGDRHADAERPNKPVPLSGGGAIPCVTAYLRNDGSVGRVPTELPYYEIDEFPIVVRRNTMSDRRMLGQSDCTFIRPQQQAINKVESRILQKLMRGSVTPIVPEDAQISVNNSVFGQVIRLRPGESAAQYGKVDTTPDISRDVLEAERLYDQAKRIVGISDTYQGMDTNVGNISGVARQLQVSQTAGRLESKRRMKNAAYAKLDRLIFLYCLSYADETRDLCYLDAWGREQNVSFNRYDFYRFDPETGVYSVDDRFLFSADLGQGAQIGRESLWERNLANLKAGTLGDPTDPGTLLRYWQQQERAHYPFARDQVEYFRGLGKGKEVDRENEDQNERVADLDSVRLFGEKGDLRRALEAP